MTMIVNGQNSHLRPPPSPRPLELWGLLGLSSKLKTCDLASESEITKHSANDVPLWVIADLPTCTMQCLPTVG